MFRCAHRGRVRTYVRIETKEKAVKGCAYLAGLLLMTTVVPLSAAQEAPPGYRIGPEDVLHISVWKEQELDRQTIVRPDGGISFPLAGDLPVAGKTPQEVQADITQRLRNYIPGAVVTVSVSEIAGYRVYVIGKVNNPGQFVVGRYVDVMQALTLAGGLTPYASEDDIRVIRRMGPKEQVFKFDYGDAKQGDGLNNNILLQSGDVVVVP